MSVVPPLGTYRCTVYLKGHLVTNFLYPVASYIMLNDWSWIYQWTNPFGIIAQKSDRCSVAIQLNADLEAFMVHQFGCPLVMYNISIIMIHIIRFHNKNIDIVIYYDPDI